MNIVIIGSGNVAAVLGRMFRAAGHSIAQVVSRNAQAASELAYEWDSESANYMTLLNREADLYVIAVSDDAIAPMVKDLRLPGAMVVHTAAAVSKDVLSEVSENFGVLYPLQSLRKEMPTLPEVPLYIDGSNERTVRRLSDLVSGLSPRTAQAASDAQRVKLHVAAVFASNFTNHLYALSQEYCRREGIDHTQLFPLILETATRLPSAPAVQLQTGPAVRGDQHTMELHLELLRDYPHLQDVYRTLSESIRQLA